MRRYRRLVPAPAPDAARLTSWPICRVWQLLFLVAAPAVRCSLAADGEAGQGRRRRPGWRESVRCPGKPARVPADGTSVSIRFHGLVAAHRHPALREQGRPVWASARLPPYTLALKRRCRARTKKKQKNKVSLRSFKAASWRGLKKCCDSRSSPS